MQPDRIGQFEILAEIAAWGEGGAIYRAKDVKGRMVLLRTLRLDRPGAAERLMRLSLEAKAASALNSPNIAGVLGGGKAGDVYLVGWEFVEGVKLSTTLEKGEVLSPSELTDLSRQICLGLDHAHSKAVIHPELKPGNIIVEWDGTAKLLDFGMPRKSVAGIEISEALHYVSPEEIQGKQPGPRANLFSWGVILYQMATGQRPFRGETAEALRQKILEETPAPPHEVKSDVHPGLSRIILKTLSKIPTDRYASGAELMRDLENYKRVEVTPPAPPKPAPPPPRPVTAQTAAPDLRPKPVPAAVPPAVPAPVVAPAPSAPPASAPPPVVKTEAQPAAAASVEAPAAEQPVTAAAPKSERPPAPAKPAAQTPKAVPPKLLMYGMAGVIVLLLVVIVIGIAVLRKTPATPESAGTSGTPVAAPGATTADTAAANPVQPETTTAPASNAPLGSGAASSSSTRAAKTKQPPAEPPKPTVVPGQVQIDSAPQGAEIQIDGRHEPNWITPYTASLEPGKHTITLSMAGRMSATRTVDVASAKSVALAVGLAERAATISVSSDPPEAVILLDGQATGKVTPAQLIVAKGSHTVLVRKQGYLDASNTLDLASGQAAQFAPTLKLTGSTQDIKTIGGIGGLFGGAPKDAGRVTVRTNPKGAQVLVNGQAVKKTTPVDFFLNPGNYEITLALAGHKPVRKIITVEKGGKLVVEETLP